MSIKFKENNKIYVTIDFMYLKIRKWMEKALLFCGCFAFKTIPFIILAFLLSYVPYYDFLFSSLVVLSMIAFFAISYRFYLTHTLESRDELLDILEKSGRKALSIDEDAEALLLFQKASTCPIPDFAKFGKDKPKKDRGFALNIIYLGSSYLTIYTGCPKSHLYKDELDAKGKKKKGCGQNIEYYYSKIHDVRFEKDKIQIILVNKHIEEVLADGGPGNKAVIQIRKKLRS